MKKRSACKIITGVVAACVINSGHCGRIDLVGTGVVTLPLRVELEGIKRKHSDTEYDMGIGCVVCAGFHGPCVGAAPRSVTVTFRQNTRQVVANTGTGYGGKKGTEYRWTPGDAGERTALGLDVICDNYVNRNWTWVDVQFYRDRRYPASTVHVTATNMIKGVTEHSDGDWVGSEWYPKWGSVVGKPGLPGRVSVSYADHVDLRGLNSKARVLYDVVGDAPVTARIDKLPNGLSCERSSDGLTIGSGATADIGPGDAITCTNVLRDKVRTNDTMSVTAMVR